jgi:flagellar biosynthetic protein FliR
MDRLPFLAGNAYINLILLHFMISVRFLGMIMTASAFVLPTVPNTVKYWLSVMLAVVVTPAVEASIPAITLGSLTMIFVMAGREFLIGIALGFATSLPLYALQTSGFIDGSLMGLNMLNMFDPLSQAQISVLAQMKYMLAIWFFFHWDGHMLLVRALAESVKLVPTGVGVWDGMDGALWIDWIQRVFVVAMKISLPVFGSIMLAEIGLGFVARTVPQLNVFVLGIPLKIAIGLFVLVAVMPAATDIFHSEIEYAVARALEGILVLR